MVYPNLKFPKQNKRPFFYTNFAVTLDGKVQVLNSSNAYWPIGSDIDKEILIELRAYADCLIHGKNLAKEFGRITESSLNKPSFRKLRTDLGKSPDLPYYIVTNHPEKLADLNIKATVAPSDLISLSQELNKKGYKNILVEGGPTLLGSFLRENLIDEVFLTLVPKIFGSGQKLTLTLVEGILFPPEKIKSLKLLSLKQVENEVFLRYQVI